MTKKEIGISLGTYLEWLQAARLSGGKQDILAKSGGGVARPIWSQRRGLNLSRTTVKNNRVKSSYHQMKVFMLYLIMERLIPGQRQ